MLEPPCRLGALGGLQCAAGVGDAFGGGADLELCLSNVRVDHCSPFVVGVVADGVKGGLSCVDHVAFIAEMDVRGQVEGGHASGIKESSPRSFPMGPCTTECFVCLLQELDGLALAECCKLLGFPAQQPCARRVVALGGEESLRLPYGTQRRLPLDGVRLIGVGVCLDDRVSALLGGER